MNIEQVTAKQVRRAWEALWDAECQSPRDATQVRRLRDAYREVLDARLDALP